MGIRTIMTVAAIAAAVAAAQPVHAKRAQDQTFLQPDAAAALPGKTFAIVVHAPTPYSATSRELASKSKWVFFAGGLLAGIPYQNSHARAAGAGVTDRTGAEDPATIGRDILADALQRGRGMQALPVDATRVEHLDADELAQRHPEADYVLDVRTVRWGHAPNPGDKQHAIVFYASEMQLIDVRTGKTAAWVKCEINTSKAKDPPVLDDIEREDGRLIKQAIGHLAWSCARQFANVRMGIAPDKIAPVPAEFEAPFH
jgi:hypothetical protein